MHFTGCVEAVPKHCRDELACLHGQDPFHREAMGFHQSPIAAPSPHGATACRWPAYHRGHPLYPYHRVPLARPPTRVWRANHGVAAAQTLGRGGHLGPHLACCPRRPRPAGSTRLEHGLSRRLVRPRQARRGQGWAHQEALYGMFKVSVVKNRSRYGEGSCTTLPSFVLAGGAY